MNILIVFILNIKSIHKNSTYDVRFEILKNIAYYLKNKHNIFIAPCDKGTSLPNDIKKDFILYDNSKPIELCISWYPVLNNFIKNKNCQYICYENGHIKNSLIIDPKGLLSGTKYIDTLNLLCENNYDENSDKYRINYIKNNFSKRPQNSNNDLPDIITNNYVFIPTQKHNDISLKNARIGMMECIEKTVNLCKINNVPLVIKIHPHLEGGLLNFQVNFINNLKKNIYNDIYLSKMSINTLMTNALFTISLNGSTIMDNFMNLTPTLVLLPCLYSNTDAVIYSDNIETGFYILLNKQYDFEKMIDKQKKIISWYLQHNLFLEYSVEDNIKILEKHLTIKLL